MRLLIATTYGHTVRSPVHGPWGFNLALGGNPFNGMGGKG